MSYYDEELEGMVNSIEKNLNKSKMKRYSFFGLILISFGILFILPNTQHPPPIAYVAMAIGIISSLGVVYEDNKREKIFKGMEEKVFFYLFYSWKHHHDDQSKKYLKVCADELNAYLGAYKRLAYTEEIYSTFDALRDTLIYHIYPKLGIRGAFEQHSDLDNQTLAWNEFKSLSIDFYQNAPITSVNGRISTLKKLFARDETIKLDSGNKLIKTIKVLADWNIDMYKNSLSYRFVFYLIITGIINYLLISKDMVNYDVIIPATILIPIMAPYYLAPQNKSNY